MSPSFARDRLIAAALAGGSLFVSRNAGSSWQQVSPPASGGEVVALAFARSVSGEPLLLAAIVAEREGAREVHAWQGRVDGRSWEQVFASSGVQLPLRLGVSCSSAGEDGVLISVGDQVLRTMRCALEVREGRSYPQWLNSGMTAGVRERGVEMICRNLHRFREGEPLHQLVDKKAGY